MPWPCERSSARPARLCSLVLVPRPPSLRRDRRAPGVATSRHVPPPLRSSPHARASRSEAPPCHGGCFGARLRRRPSANSPDRLSRVHARRGTRTPAAFDKLRLAVVSRPRPAFPLRALQTVERRPALFPSPRSRRKLRPPDAGARTASHRRTGLSLRPAPASRRARATLMWPGEVSPQSPSLRFPTRRPARLQAGLRFHRVVASQRRHRGLRRANGIPPACAVLFHRARSSPSFTPPLRSAPAVAVP